MTINSVSHVTIGSAMQTLAKVGCQLVGRFGDLRRSAGVHVLDDVADGQVSMQPARWVSKPTLRIRWILNRVGVGRAR